MSFVKNKLQNVFTPKTSVFQYIFAICFVGIIMQTAFACQHSQSDISTKRFTFSSNEALTVADQPREIQMFHLNPENDFGNQPIVLSWYLHPYQDNFDFVVITEDSVVKIFSEWPNWARQGGIAPTRLAPEEHQIINTLIESLAETRIQNTGSDTVVITISFEFVKGERQVMTCLQPACQEEIQEIFKIIYSVFKQKNGHDLILSMPFADV